MFAISKVKSVGGVGVMIVTLAISKVQGVWIGIVVEGMLVTLAISKVSSGGWMYLWAPCNPSWAPYLDRALCALSPFSSQLLRPCWLAFTVDIYT